MYLKQRDQAKNILSSYTTSFLKRLIKLCDSESPIPVRRVDFGSLSYQDWKDVANNILANRQCPL